MTITIDSGATWQVLYDPGTSDTDITDYVISIDKCTDVANEINTAIIQLDADFGQFITESTSGATPILAKWDKIKITLTDKNDNSYSRIFLVKTLFKKRKQTENLRLEVHLVGQEFWLTRMPFPKPFYFESAYNTVRDIVDIYNDSNGTGQAEIENHDDGTENLLPKYTANNFTFGLKEKFCWDGMMEVIDKMANSVSNLGAGDFYYIHFKDKSANPNVIELEADASGNKPASPLTLQNSNTAPLFSIEEEHDAETATIVGAKGLRDFGSLPPDYAEFRDLIEAWQLLPTHPGDGSISYPQNAWVQYNGTRYQSNINDNTSVPPTNWTSKTQSDWIGAKDYSPWTNGNPNAWKNSGSNASGTAGGSGTGFDQKGCWDSNLVVLDEDNYQNWVHIKSTTDNFDVNYKYGAASGGVYKGLRCLVNGTGTGAFSGYDNKIMQYDGSAWQEIGPRGNSGIRTAVDGDRVAIRHEGLVYKYNGSSWVDDSTGQRANHCFHVYSELVDSQGVNLTSDGAGGDYGDNSAKKWSYDYTPIDGTGALPLTTVVGYYSIGAWANISFPFPENSYNGQTLGSIYGGNTTDKEPATLNADNLIYTAAGNKGFNETDADDLYPLTGVEFMVKMDWFVSLVSDTRVPYEGNFKYRVYFYDLSDNVVYADFQISHLDTWTQVRLPFTSFKVYRARTPLTLGEIASNIIVPELEVHDVFDWRNVKLGVIQWQEVYDDEGRFKPEASRALTSPLKVGSFVPGSTTTVDLYIDAFHFTKQAFRLSGTDATRPQFAFLEAPDITNSFQLKNAADSQEEVEKFEYRSFSIDTELRCDIEAEHSFYLVDSELIADDDDSSGGVKLVAREINYTVNASQGRGGIHTEIVGVKRING